MTLLLILALTFIIFCSRRKASNLLVQENISYIVKQTPATPGDPSRAKVEEESAPTYSSLGPEYDNLTVNNSRSQQTFKNQIPNNVSERYEFAEIHVETDRARVTVPVLVEGDDDDYSRLQR